jgi:hypothetical protein
MRGINRLVVRALAAAALCVLPAAAQAVVTISSGPASPLPSELSARARWGGSGFESVILDSGTAIPATQMNPAGAPVWQLGQPYDFRLAWDWSSGTITWQIDFNRNGSFSAAETSRYIDAALVGSSFQYVRMTLSAQTNGGNSSGIDISNLSIDGTSLGNFTHSGNVDRTNWFESSTGFRDIEILGQLTFRRLSGNGNSVFQSERPRVEFAFVDPEPIPEPAAWAMLMTGFGLVGAIGRRRRQSVTA